jgi:hypothetical protein
MKTCLPVLERFSDYPRVFRAAGDRERILPGAPAVLTQRGLVTQLLDFLAAGIGVTRERIAEYVNRMREFHGLVDAGKPVLIARGDRHPEHSYAGRLTDILSDGQLQIRARIEVWVVRHGLPLYAVYDQLLDRDRVREAA